ncbi:assimilatory sulfite reductase (NADPH) hemoprotein subunit [Algicola sagamiensis]|uniref:assimilatory sulfite reductase (NADPH) hemoprotein subunit n=1 Tax=Algicola sagamiensis TaxID=163869 RepID=UPI000371E7DE|nr:assimilatory sulfite reductase (NADPH) hemoprotein subunit [Algicola sagamiensis]
MSQKAANEGIKDRSNYLRGTIVEGLKDPITGALPEDDTQLTKFHGFYQQDDRDLRKERKDQKLEPLYSFMLRARVPGGVATPKQWLAIDKIADEHTVYGSLRLTTRQTFQYHGILKSDVKPLIQGINAVMLDSLAACGDVNRNVLCNTNPVESELHADAYDWAVKISEHLLPQTKAYYEIWLDGEVVAGNQDEQEPVYGKHYLPRKFKTAVAIPPHNDVDVFANDLGFIAIAENGKLIGFNVTVGGGMGMTHGDVTTYPQLAKTLGFISPEETLKVAEAVVTTQRDWGNRESRKHARLKYTVDRVGLDALKQEVEKRSGVIFGKERDYTFTQNSDRYGWVKGIDSRWHLTLYIENGRLVDTPKRQLKTGLREIAKVHQGDFRMTATQNIIIANVPESEKDKIAAMAREYGLWREDLTPIRQNAMACVAFPTCALAMAESERYLPSLIDKIESIFAANGLAQQPVVTRMTGCPNGCARPYLAEIGFVGKGPGKYNFYLGGSHLGSRLNQLYRENIGEQEILAALEPLVADFAKQKQRDEAFGDFLVRTGVVKAVIDGREFHG